MSDVAKTVVVLALVVAFLGGYLVGNQQGGFASERDLTMAESKAYSHADHGTLDVSATAAIPKVDVIVHNDALSGRNLEMVTDNFRFAPEHVGLEHVAGEGHAHLYMDGKKVARLYGRWFHIPEPARGTHRIKVTLNANSHQTLVVDGQAIEDVETLIVTDS